MAPVRKLELEGIVLVRKRTTALANLSHKIQKKI
jgi:hypothetical protein